MSRYFSTVGPAVAIFSAEGRDRRAICVKRVVDMALLVLLGPLALVIVVPIMMVLWGQGGRVFYSQMRVGKDGQLFRLWKFRTMAQDADARLREHLAMCPQAAAEWARGGKLRVDPRIRPLGHFLRRMSLDELPQLWNVIRGEMSLVGPRPVRPDELVVVYGASAAAYKSCLPGLSGLWQVSGRNRLGYAQRAALDRHYAQHRSLRMDLWILLRTVRAVLSGSGC